MIDISSLYQRFQDELSQVRASGILEQLMQKYVGKQGEVTLLLKNLVNVPIEERKIIGGQLQDLRQTIETALEEKLSHLEFQEITAKEAQESLDVTQPSHTMLGSLHPLTQVQHQLVDVFQSLGFAVLRGPEAESEYYNFEALNIPSTHPARDMQDTFFLRSGVVMRTHTSPVQVRAMEKYGAPLRMIVPGRVFRNEALDASHEHTFYQLEGMMIDENLTISNLLAVMKLLLKEMFGREIKVRLRPGYFPFVEPGFELDAECAFCSGKGCNVCKHSGWIELIPCGMIHPKVLEYGKIDTKK